MFYGPSRFIWFSIGSIATLTWMHYHQQHKDRPFSRIGCGPRAQWERNAPPYGSAGNNATSWGGQGVANGQPHDGSIAEALQSSRPIDHMDQERERLRQLGRNAEETISGMSEVTIDSMMNGLQRLKDVSPLGRRVEALLTDHCCVNYR
ncbi:hypothetical protein BGW80DRAFT_1346183 [Lactifluus volemus]|nr:hypothetical protein BGW80DRAFT_1346183 [Lactifluus volemus]